MEKLKNFIKSYPHTSYAFITGFELIVDDYKKILPDHMTQLATILGIRIKCR